MILIMAIAVDLDKIQPWFSFVSSALRGRIAMGDVKFDRSNLRVYQPSVIFYSSSTTGTTLRQY